MKNTILKSAKLCVAILILAGAIVFFLFCYTHIRFSKTAYTPRFNDQKLHPEKNNFKVCVFGDFAMQNGVVEPIMQEISNSDVDFAICTGDIFRHSSTGSALYLKEMFYKNLHKPFFALPAITIKMKKRERYLIIACLEEQNSIILRMAILYILHWTPQMKVSVTSARNIC